MTWKKTFLMIIFICFTYFEANNQENPFTKNKEEVYKEWLRHLDFSPERMYKYLSYQGLSEEILQIIITQSILETGYYSSSIFIKNNNLFGMKHPRIRETTSIGINKGHAKYLHWTDSIDDYILWMNYYESRGILCLDNYKSFLQKVGYAEDPLYINKLKILNIG